MRVIAFLVLHATLSAAVTLTCLAFYCGPTQRSNSVCDVACMVSQCGYDSATSAQSQCWSQCPSTCTGLLGNGVCNTGTAHTECNSDVCGWDKGDCGYCSSGCKRYLGTTGMLGNGVCEEECNVAQCHYDAGDCLGSTRPFEVYVTASGGTSGVGTYTSPFTSLHSALLAIWAPYTKVYLLAGTHVFSQASFNLNPLAAMGTKLISLAITTLFCASSVHPQCASDRAVIRLTSSRIVFTVYNSMTVSDVEVSGRFDILSGCFEENCVYCPYTVLDALTKSYENDRGEVVDITKIAVQTLCQNYRNSYLFSANSGSSLTFTNARFTDLRQQLQAVINVNCGQLWMTNVDFYNSQISPRGLRGIITAAGPTNPRGYACGTFNYTNGVVSLTNNGYEQQATTSSSGFAVLDSYTVLIVSNVTFAYNNVYNGQRSAVLGALLYIRNFREARIYNCVFDRNIGKTAGAIYVTTAITLPTLLNSNLALIDQALVHLVIENCTFTNNTAANGAAIALNFAGDHQNVVLRNCTFQNNFATDRAVLDISNSLLTSEFTTGAFLSVLSDGVNHTVFSPPRYVTIDSCAFLDNYAPYTVALSQVGALTIHSSVFHGNGQSLSQITASAFTYSSYVAETNVYMKIVPQVPSSVCRGLIYGVDVYRVSIHSHAFFDTYCPSGSSGLSFSGALVEVDIYNLTFANNVGAGALTLSPGADLYLSSLTFRNNTLEDQEASVCLHLDLPTPVAVTVENSEFTENRGTSSVAMYVSGASALQVANITVRGNTGSSAGAGVVYMVPASLATKLQVSSSVFYNNSARSNGVISVGGMKGSAGGDATDTLDISVTSTTFESNTATYTGAGITVNDYLTLSGTSVISGSRFAGNRCDEKGGGVYLAFDSGLLTISTCSFVGNAATEGAAVYSSHRATGTAASLLAITDCSFTRNSGFSAVILDGEGNRPNIRTSRNNFSDGFCTAVKILNGIWNDTNSIYQRNAFSQGAVSFISLGTEATMDTITATNNTAEEYGGAFYITNSATLRLYTSTVTNNTSLKIGGVVYIDQSSAFRCRDSNFTGNSAAEKGAVVFQLFSAVSMTGVRLQGNSAGFYGTIYSSDSNLTLTNCAISGNTAKGITPGVAVMLTVLKVTNSSFSSQIANTGAFLFGQDGSVVTVQNSSFSNCSADSQGGALYFSASAVTIAASRFSNCFANTGGVMTFINVCKVNITSTSVASNKANLGGFVIEVDQGFFGMYTSRIEGFEGGGVSIARMEKTELVGTVVLSGNNNLGGGLLISDTDHATVTGCYFSALMAYIGGALLAYSTQSATHAITVTDSAFAYNFAGSGGVVFSESYDIVFERCAFVGNQALAMDTKSGLGGVMYLGCSYNPSCALAIQDNTFANNSAAVSGGAVMWRANPPLFANNTFTNNVAVYGSDIASYAIRLAAVTKDMQIVSYLDDLSIEDYTVAYNIENLGSGFMFDGMIRVALLDHQNQIITSDSASGAEFIIPPGSNLTIFGNIKAIASHGVFEFTSFTLSAPTGSVQTLLLSVPSISAQTLTAYDQSIMIDTLAIRLTFRPCLIGEYLQDSQCHECPSGTYSFSPSVACAQCPSHAICYGNYTMVPRSGYWRPDVYSPKIFECPYAAACVGSPEPPQLSLSGDCDVGYGGNLCAICSPGYSKTGKNYCLKCPRREVNSVILALILVGALCLLVLVIYIAISTAGNKSEFGIYVKILMNYMQMVVIAASLDLKWPEFVEAFLSTQDMIGGLADQIFSVDCMLQDFYAGKIVYVKVAIAGLLPIVLLSLSVVFWLCMKICRKPRLLPDKMITSLVMIIFVLHPSITKSSFSLFSCREIKPGEFWLIKDLSTQCWTSIHIRDILIISLPGIIVWVMGLPLCCLLYLVKRKRYLAEIKMQMRLSFLYKGYTSEVYYWEFVILYRKILLVCSFVFLGIVSIRVQALSVLAVLITSLLLQIKVHPFLTRPLNQLEVKSILVSTVTIYIGLYYETQKLSKH